MFLFPGPGFEFGQWNGEFGPCSHHAAFNLERGTTCFKQLDDQHLFPIGADMQHKLHLPAAPRSEWHHQHRRARGLRLWAPADYGAGIRLGTGFRLPRRMGLQQLWIALEWERARLCAAWCKLLLPLMLTVAPWS